MNAKPRGRPLGVTGPQAQPARTPYTLWLTTPAPRDALCFVMEVDDYRKDAALAATARRHGVKVSTSRGVAVYGQTVVKVIRIVKE